MSLLTVEKVTHGFGARQILEDASFRLLKGEHIGLIGANGEGKSTFLRSCTPRLITCTIWKPKCSSCMRIWRCRRTRTRWMR